MSHKVISIILIGNQSVGKSSLSRRFCNGNFIENYSATVGIDFLSKTINRAQTTIEVKVWDSAGSERFQTLTTQYIRKAHAALLVFDLTDKSSFENMTNWINKLVDVKNLPKVLAGNKCDLKGAVNINEVKRYADNIGIKFFKTSAKTGENVDTCFEELVDMYFNEENKNKAVEIPTVVLGEEKTEEKPERQKKCC